MLSQQEISKIKEHLNQSQNPIFLFDDDPDGLASFLILQRGSEKGRGVAVKSYPALSREYISKINEFNADAVFILDKPVVSQEFFEEVRKMNLPIIWIDHHEKQGEIPEYVAYFNPLYSQEKSDEPVSFLCYEVIQNEKDIWLAIVGGVADKYLPKYYEAFKKEYPDLSMDSTEPFDILYKTQIGKISRMVHAGLKDKTSNVNKMLQFLMNVKSPYEVLEEKKENAQMHKRFNEIEEKIMKFLRKARETGEQDGDLLFFKYGGDTSFSGDLANRIRYEFPHKTVVVAYLKGNVVNISARGEKIKEKVLKAIKDLEGSNGGGHEKAVGARIRIEDLEKFHEKMQEMC